MIFALISAVISTSGMLIVQPGEAVLFHLVDGRPVIDAVESRGAPPAGSLSVSVAVDVPGGPPGTIMTIVNGTTQWLNYKAAIDFGDRGGPTSVCTIMNNGRTGFERWPEKLKAVAIGNFTPAPAEGVVCR